MDLKVDKDTNDLVMSSGDFVTTTGLEEAAQRIRDRLLTFRGEYYLNLSYGVDYIGKILIKNPKTSVIAAHIRSEILKSVTGKITSFESLLKNRELSVTYGLTIDGDTLIDELILKRIEAEVEEAPIIDYALWAEGEVIEWATDDFMGWV